MKKREVLEEILRARSNRAAGLSLSGNELRSLPLEIGKLTNLVELYLSENLLTSLPPEIGQIENLRELDLSGNQLTSLPPEIGKLTNLQKLKLSENQLTSLSPEIGQMENLRELDLSGNQLTSLPPEIGKLTNLQKLKLSENQLTSLSPEIGKLTNLQTLHLFGNQLIGLPSEIGQLANLQTLYLYRNQLKSLPRDLGRLTRLQTLSLDANELTNLPPELGQLAFLRMLDLSGNELTGLPPELGQLANLEELDLSGNQLTRLPPELGQLTNLHKLHLGKNPLVSPPSDIVAQGVKVVVKYLRALLEESAAMVPLGSQRQWTAKLVVLGEGGVGKTSLLHRLRGEEFDREEVKTRGFELGKLSLGHPSERDVAMTLNTWDFGGQREYHATHQYFLTDDSLVLILWNSRLGYAQGKIPYWLDIVKARAEKAKVILIGTHCHDHATEVPFTDYKKDYSFSVDGKPCGLVSDRCFYIDNDTGEGIEELKAEICRVAASLSLMGAVRPSHWGKAMEDVRSWDRPYCQQSEFCERLRTNGVGEGEVNIVADSMQQLGDIIWHRTEPLIDDIVLLKPGWASDYICRIIDDEEVINRKGILTKERMNYIWRDLNFDFREHLLRVMERFDLSYRTLEDAEISLVVDRLKIDRPASFGEFWKDPVADQKQLSMKFHIPGNFPPGVPTFFIARSHRHTLKDGEWQRGALLREGGSTSNLGLIEAFPDKERFVRLSVRGQSPLWFFAFLRMGFEDVLKQQRGIYPEITRSIPCPTWRDGKLCDLDFDYAHLEKLWQNPKAPKEVYCTKCETSHFVGTLLHAISPTTQEMLREDIAKLRTENKDANQQQMAKLNQLLGVLEIHYIDWLRVEQQKLDAQCPTGFMIDWVNPSNRDGDIYLHLYCQNPEKWHETPNGGIGTPKNGKYRIARSNERLVAIAPFVSRLKNFMEKYAPAAGTLGSILLMLSTGGAAGSVAPLMSKRMGEMVKHLGEMIPDVSASNAEQLAKRFEIGWNEIEPGSALRSLRSLLHELDPNQVWGGLQPVLTKEYGILWLCDKCAGAYRQ